MSGIAVRTDDLATTIRISDETFLRNIAAGDVEALVDNFYATDAVILPPGAPRITGREAIVAFWKGMLGMGISKMSLETTEVSSSGDLAYGVGRYGLSVGGHDQVGKFVVVYRRQADGNYRAVVDSFSPDA